MIKIYSGDYALSYKHKHIIQADIEFKFYDLSKLDSTAQDLLYLIDRAKIVNVDKGKLETDYGVIGKDDLSTGVKTLLLAYQYARDNISALICIDECGKNIIDKLFSIADNSCVSLELNHCTIPFNLSYDFVLNDTIHCNNSLELAEKISEVD